MKMKAFKCPECGGNIDVTADRGISFCPFCGSRLYDEDSINININKNVNKNIRDYAKMRKAEAYEKIQLEKMKREGDTGNSKRFYGFLLMVVIILVTAVVIIFTGQAEVILFSIYGLFFCHSLMSSK